MREYQDRLKKNILQKMGETGATIESLAAGAQIQPSTIWRLLNDKCDPKLSTVAAIARHLGTDIQELFRPLEG